MDPFTLTRLAIIRQQELLKQAEQARQFQRRNKKRHTNLMESKYDNDPLPDNL